jgi:DDE_Tnp_1-associated
MQQPLTVFLDHFSGLEDSREAGKVLHPVPEILLVTLCGVLAGAEGFEDIEDYGESKLDLLREFLPFAHGMPSDDTLRRFFRAVIRTRLPRCSWRSCAMCFPKRPSA